MAYANKAKQQATRRAWEAARRATGYKQDRDPQQKRNENLIRKFGITLNQYEALLAYQGGRCAICRTDSCGGRGTWHTDHNHVTGRVRGLLCNRCNVSIGLLKESVLVLESAIEYLKYNEVTTQHFLAQPLLGVPRYY